MRRRQRELGLVVAVALTGACTFVTSLDGYSEGGTVADAGQDAPPTLGAVDSGGAVDAGDAGDACGDGGVLRGGVCLAKPVAHWRFDEGSGSVAADSAGAASGTVAKATWVPGHVGPHALDFDGVSSTVEIGAVPQLSFGTSSFSLALLIRQTTPAGLYDVAFWKGGSSVAEVGYDIELGSEGWVAGLSDGTTLKVVPFGVAITASWVRLVVVVDRSANELRGYKNGAIIGSASLVGFGSVSSGQPAAIGSLDGSYPFKGAIDDVLIFDRALTAAEVAALNP